MKKWFKLFLAGMLFLCLSGTANAITLASFGKILASDSTIDQWLLTLIYDSDLSITLGNSSSSYTFYGPGVGSTTLSAGQTYTFSGLSSGSTYYASSGSSQPPTNGDQDGGSSDYDYVDINDTVYQTDDFPRNGLELTITPVPEPATMFLFGIGLFFLAGLLRKVRS